MAKVQVGLRLDPALAVAVDAARGLVPRNRFLEELIGRALGEASASAGSEIRSGTPGASSPESTSRRASGPRSVVREGAPMTEVPKIAKRWWADE